MPLVTLRDETPESDFTVPVLLDFLGGEVATQLALHTSSSRNVGETLGDRRWYLLPGSCGERIDRGLTVLRVRLGTPCAVLVLGEVS